MERNWRVPNNWKEPWKKSWKKLGMNWKKYERNLLPFLTLFRWYFPSIQFLPQDPVPIIDSSEIASQFILSSFRDFLHCYLLVFFMFLLKFPIGPSNSSTTRLPSSLKNVIPVLSITIIYIPLKVQGFPVLSHNLLLIPVVSYVNDRWTCPDLISGLISSWDPRIHIAHQITRSAEVVSFHPKVVSDFYLEL